MIIEIMDDANEPDNQVDSIALATEFIQPLSGMKQSGKVWADGSCASSNE